MTDAELLDAYLETEKVDYFGELYGRYMPLVYGVCLKYLRSQENAEDAVMQIFEELVGKVGRYYVKEFRTWVYTVARNHCLQKLRKRKTEILSGSDNGFMEFADITHLLSERDDESRYKALEECIEQLPEPQKKSVLLFFMEEKSYADIVDATNYQLKSVKSYIQNGKRNLKNCLEKQGVNK